jgi:hypothetical protein
MIGELSQSYATFSTCANQSVLRLLGTGACVLISICRSNWPCCNQDIAFSISRKYAKASILMVNYPSLPNYALNPMFSSLFVVGSRPSVRLTKVLSSRYRRLPIDLCILIQKNCPYSSQLTRILARFSGLATVFPSLIAILKLMNGLYSMRELVLSPHVKKICGFDHCLSCERSPQTDLAC